jgi:hypothetical protein
MQDQLDELLDGKASEFLQTIRTEKSRYARDQFKLIRALYDRHGIEDILDAIEFCRYSKLFSANYVKDYLGHKASLQPEMPVIQIPVSNSKYHITTQKRSIDVYAKVGGIR